MENLLSQEEISYFNLLALGLQIVDSFNDNTSKINALANFAKIRKATYDKMNVLWEEGIQAFLNTTNAYLGQIKNMSNGTKHIAALTVCIFLDSKITYDKEYDPNQFFGVPNLVPRGNGQSIVYSLNGNYSETGIWINPRFPTRNYHEQKRIVKQKKRIENRDVFHGINGSLHHCSYFQWDKSCPKIKNIVLSEASILQKHNQFIRLGFSPLTVETNLLSCTTEQVSMSGYTYNGLVPSLIVDTTNQISASWELACANQVDVFFMPEMLMPIEKQAVENGYNYFIAGLCVENLESSRPLVTLLPSCWANHNNSLQVVDQDGSVLAIKSKNIPYVDEENHCIESIPQKKSAEITTIHINEIDRVSVLICAEFLSEDSDLEFLCRDLLTTLLVVPSYSQGEQDFINTLPRVRKYGTTVIWGNCCGAIKSSEKAIGGLAIAGEHEEHLMGPSCQCKHSCMSVDGCLFYCDLPITGTPSKCKNSVLDFRQEFGKA